LRDAVAKLSAINAEVLLKGHGRVIKQFPKAGTEIKLIKQIRLTGSEKG